MEVECETCGKKVDEGDCEYIQELDKQVCDNCQEESDVLFDMERKEHNEKNNN